MRRANITNGEYFNRHFEETYCEDGVPFNEAMMVGDSAAELFSEDFCKIRAACLNTTIEEYKQTMGAFFSLMNNLGGVEEIVLWFGADAFCQLNLLTILTYLEEKDFGGRVYTVIIEDESFKIIREKSQVTLGSFRELYENVILRKTKVHCGNTLTDGAVALYFDYLSDDGMLANMVKANAGLPAYELAVKLISAGREYGISDSMAYALIEKYCSNCQNS